MLKKPWMLGLGLPADDCITLTDEEGECLAREQCQHAGGQPAGACHQGDQQLSFYVAFQCILTAAGMDYSPYPRVCCVHKTACSGATAKEVSYFTSVHHPAPVTNTSCRMELTLLPGVCQVSDGD